MERSLNPSLPRELYLELLKRCVTNVIYQDSPIAPGVPSSSKLGQFDLGRRSRGVDWPSLAHSMLGLARLQNLQDVVATVIEEEIPGDFCEAGVWRGGAAVFMRGLLAAWDVKDRKLWLADSFEGLCPPPGSAGLSSRSYSSPSLRAAREPAWDSNSDVLKMLRAGTSLEEVRSTFERYGLLDEQVQFVKGYYCDTLASLDCQRLALIHVDCDLYDSTLQVLHTLYPKLSDGGFVVIDDYGTFRECREAVDEFRSDSGEQGPISTVDAHAVYWRKRASRE